MAQTYYGYTEKQLREALDSVVLITKRTGELPSPLARADTAILADALDELIARRAGLPQESGPASWWQTIVGLVAQMQAAGQASQGSRELSLTITKLQEAGFWLAGVAATGDRP